MSCSRSSACTRFSLLVLCLLVLMLTHAPPLALTPPPLLTHDPPPSSPLAHPHAPCPIAPYSSSLANSRSPVSLMLLLRLLLTPLPLAHPPTPYSSLLPISLSLMLLLCSLCFTLHPPRSILLRLLLLTLILHSPSNSLFLAPPMQCPSTLHSSLALESFSSPALFAGVPASVDLSAACTGRQI